MKSTGEIKWTDVVSSNIKAVSWDAVTDTLYVKFHNGGIYAYSGVRDDTFHRLIEAPSIGGYFAAFIRDNYTTEKLR